MPKVTYVQPDGSAQSFEVPVGLTVMQGAVINDVSGVKAECGGACACATCQVYVDEAWTAHAGSLGPLEASMIEDAEATRPNLRLSCQIPVTQELDGLIVYIPEH